VVGNRAEASVGTRVIENILATRRNAPIDGLRAVSIAAVFAFHALPEIVPGGYLGVDLFFVISGFLITTSLLQEAARAGRIDLQDFYLRRLFRIFPALVVFVAISIPLNALFPLESHGYAIPNAAAALSSTMNIFKGWDALTGGILAGTWSLSMEEQFYLLWPAFIIFWVSKPRKHDLATILGLSIITVVGWRLYLVWQGATPQRLYFSSDTRADAILLGCLLAIVVKGVPGKLLGLWAVPAVLLVLIFLSVPIYSPVLALGGYTVAAILAGWLMACVTSRQSHLSKALSLPVLQWLGRRSYSFYLWHVPMLGLARLSPAEYRYTLPAALLGALAATELSYRYIERPFIAWHRNRHRTKVSTLT
jgi:peptidoglycan/LPS O-acetylase OafA/YrhL